MKFSNSDHSPRHRTLLLFCLGLSLAYCRGLPGGSDSKESSCNAGNQVQSLGQKDPLEKGMANNSRILVWKNPMNRGSWWTTVHGVTKSQAQLSNWLFHTLTYYTFGKTQSEKIYISLMGDALGYKDSARKQRMVPQKLHLFHPPQPLHL